MYSYIKGELTAFEEQAAVVECCGIGYELQMGPMLQQALGAIGDRVTCFVHVHFTQDAQQWFGFPDQESRKLFRLLITVSGIGPKAAMSILDFFNPAQFAIAVLHSDTAALTKVKGLGKKSAERIIVDLRDKLAKSDWAAEQFSGRDLAAGSSAAPADSLDHMKEDLLEGLAYLGYQPAVAKRLIELSFDKSLGLEDNLRRAMACAGKA